MGLAFWHLGHLERDMATVDLLVAVAILQFAVGLALWHLGLLVACHSTPDSGVELEFGLGLQTMATIVHQTICQTWGRFTHMHAPEHVPAYKAQ